MAGSGRYRGGLKGEIQDLFADLWEVPRFSGPRRGFRPQCDCYRSHDPPALHLVLELPGVDPSAVEVVAEGSTLVISGTRARPSPPGARCYQLEIDYGPFERRLEFGEPIEVDEASASYDRGMLRIELPLQSP